MPHRDLGHPEFRPIAWARNFPGGAVVAASGDVQQTKRVVALQPDLVSGFEVPTWAAATPECRGFQEAKRKKSPVAMRGFLMRGFLVPKVGLEPTRF